MVRLECQQTRKAVKDFDLFIYVGIEALIIFVEVSEDWNDTEVYTSLFPCLTSFFLVHTH